ncbi:TIR domain-containing protein [Rhizobium leguminosarum]|uniref:TIR domain-containing protein n=1 Tax=Rhizobium leguminosarum TaxID=384 RepID=UPI001C9415BE|nr:TIR domain-containing protein [Rhizobium leguminosarum]MBY5551059.1 TIR domain-containing protein [Rhizobium leguminosarum]
MPKQIPPALIFLSHSVADKDLVEAFEGLLTRALNITSERIFCSSLEGQGVTKGANFVDSIKHKAAEAKAVVALISPAYMESPFCLAELGAAWVLNTHRFPIVVPPNSFEVMQATLLGVVGVKIDQEDALTQLLEDIGNTLSLPAPTAAVRARALRDFIQKWPILKESVGKAKRVDAAIHNKALSDLTTSRQVWEATQADLDKANAHIAALKQTKDRVEVAKVSKEFEDSDWEMEFDIALSDVSAIADEVGGSRILRHMILDCLGKPSTPDLRDSYIERVIEIGVFDHETKDWVQSSDEMKALKKGIKKVAAVLEAHKEAVADLKSQGKRYSPSDIRFWEQHLRLPT